MIAIPHTDRYRANVARHTDDDEQRPCAVCGRPLRKGRVSYWLYEHNGSALSQSEAIRVPKDERDLLPLGGDCLRRNPDLRPYVLTVQPSW